MLLNWFNKDVVKDEESVLDLLSGISQVMKENNYKKKQVLNIRNKYSMQYLAIGYSK